MMDKKTLKSPTWSPGLLMARELAEGRTGRELKEKAASTIARLVYPSLSGRTSNGDTDILSGFRSFLESALPRGRVTFLLGDVEGSTRLWDRNPSGTADAMERRDRIVAEVVARFGGLLPRDQGEGDSFFAVFDDPGAALQAALELQSSFLMETWPMGSEIKVRIAVHTGETQLREGNYYGLEVNRCARIRSLGHGGQILVSGSTREAVSEGLPSESSLVSLGSQPLRDLPRPEEVFQLAHPRLPSEFPALRSSELRVS